MIVATFPWTGKDRGDELEKELSYGNGLISSIGKSLPLRYLKIVSGVSTSVSVTAEQPEQ